MFLQISHQFVPHGFNHYITAISIASILVSAAADPFPLAFSGSMFIVYSDG